MPLTITAPTPTQVLNTATPLVVAAGNNVGGLLPSSGNTGNGVTAIAAGATVDNDGQIVSAGVFDSSSNAPAADAINLELGGTVNNAAGATIVGTGNGVVVSGGSGIVDNAGSISATAPDGVGVAIDTGALTNGGTISAVDAGGIGATIGTGSVTNQAGGAITGALDGVDATGSAALINAGTIVGMSGTGVNQAAGTVTNEVGGTITGALAGVTTTEQGTVDNAGLITATGSNGIGVNLLDGGVVIDSGTISGSDATGAPGGIAVNLGGDGGSTLVLGPGAVLNGVAQAAGTGNTLEIVAGNGVTSLKDIGTTVTGFGNTTIDAGASLDVVGGITSSGAVSLGDGATLTVGGPVAAGVSIGLGGAGATLNVGDVADFKGTISNLGADDTLNLTGLGLGTTVSYTPGTGLTVTTSTGVSTIIPITLPVGISLGLTPDGSSVTVGAGGTGTSVTTGGTPGGGLPGGGVTTTVTSGAGGSSTVTTDPTTGITTTTVSGTGGSSTVTTDPTSGGSAVTSTSPLGATTSMVLTPGSTFAQGTGTAAGDVVSIDTDAVFEGRGQFTITGQVASGSGVTSVTLSAVVDGASDPTVLGTAAVAADGTYSFLDTVGAHLQGFITATETDGAAATTSVQAPFSLEAGLKGLGHVAQQDRYSPDGSEQVSTSLHHKDKSRTVNVTTSGQTYSDNFFDTFNNAGAPNNTFVFDPGHGLDVVTQFRGSGADHDTIDLNSSGGTTLADVLRSTHNVAGGVLILDPNTGDSLKLTGVTKAELKANPGDFTFHA